MTSYIFLPEKMNKHYKLFKNKIYEIIILTYDFYLKIIIKIRIRILFIETFRDSG